MRTCCHSIEEPSKICETLIPIKALRNKGSVHLLDALQFRRGQLPQRPDRVEQTLDIAVLTPRHGSSTSLTMWLARGKNWELPVAKPDRDREWQADQERNGGAPAAKATSEG